MQSKWIICTKRGMLLLLAGLLVVSLSQSSTTLHAEKDSVASYNDSMTINYTDTGPIIINNDVDLLSFQTGGDGSLGNPYLISNYNITSSNNDGIYVTGTTQYFKIENNLIQVSDTGIVIDTVPAGTAIVTQNIVVSSDIGIQILNSDYILATHNNLSLCGTGLYSSMSDNGTISNNIITNNNLGISSQAGESNEYHNNLVQDNSGYGIYLDLHCFYNSIHHNAFIDNGGSSSQAFDDGWKNDFYDTDLLEGNFWSEYVSGSYSVDGMAGNEDLYPLGSIPEISEFNKTSVITILILMISSVSVISIFRKK